MYIPLFFVIEFVLEFKGSGCGVEVVFDFGFSKEFFLGREVDFL